MRASYSSAPYRGHFEDPDVPSVELYLGTYRPERPLVVRHEMGGGRPQDVVGLTLVQPLVVSQRFVDVLHAHDFNGWSALSVELYDGAGQLVPGYYALAITGRCGPVKVWRSLSLRAFLKTGELGRGLHVAPSSWDGSHLFVPERSRYALVTEPVMRALTRARLTNLEFEPISEVEVPLI